ncbi:MAG: hypothetical protein RLZZ584_744 [Pseudomonadota bacterium]
MMKSSRTRLALVLALAALLGGCGHVMHHHGPGPDGMGARGAAPITQTPGVGVADTGGGKFYPYVSQEPLIVAGTLIQADFDRLAKAGLARRSPNGALEARLVWQLAPSGSFTFVESATEAVSARSLVKGQDRSPLVDCQRDDARRVGCWVSLAQASEFKYTLRLTSPSTGVIELDPTGIVRP